MWNIINFDVKSFNQSAKEYLSTVAKIVDCETIDSISNSQFKEADGIIVRLGKTLNRSLLKNFDKLKFIATITTGLDHIDIEYCLEKDVEILTLKGETKFLEQIKATPELTWGLLLSLMRKLPFAFSSVLDGNWERELFFGNELNEKTIGIIGFGRIGKILGQYAFSFGMKVLVVDIVEIGKLDYSFQQVNLIELLESSDVVSINLPLSAETLHFFKEEHFKKMKKNSVLLNSARGALVDENALLNALEQKWISGAALDVIENETITNHISESHPLIKYARENHNLILSPHIAGSTFESMEKTACFISQKIRTYIEKY